MSDQAARLRELVLVAQSPAPNRGATIVAVSGASRRQGTTTVAANLATRLAEQQRPTALVDANLEHPAITRMLGISPAVAGSIADVLTGSRTLTEVLQNGPAGLRVVAGCESADGPPEVNGAAKDRLCTEIHRLAGRCDAVVVDAGCGLTPWTDPLWQAAQVVLLVTTPDDASLADSYAVLKLAAGGGLLPTVRLVVNRCRSPQEAEDAHQRIGGVCYRFLGELLSAAPALPNFAASDGGKLDPEYRQAVSELAASVAHELQQSADDRPNIQPWPAAA